VRATFCAAAWVLVQPPRRLRRNTYAAITLLFMAITIKHMITEGIRPFDWVMLVIEALVLLLILYEVIVGEIRHRRETARGAFLTERVAELSKLHSKGHRIQTTVLDPMINNPQILQPWIDSAEAWGKETDAILRKYSQRASRTFLLVTDAGQIDTVVTAHGRHFMVSGAIGGVYQRLVLQLENLNRIIENPALYF
jgi:hypothetical protein